MDRDLDAVEQMDGSIAISTTEPYVKDSLLTRFGATRLELPSQIAAPVANPGGGEYSWAIPVALTTTRSGFQY